MHRATFLVFVNQLLPTPRLSIFVGEYGSKWFLFSFSYLLTLQKQ